MSLRSEYGQRGTFFMLILSFIVLAVSTSITLVAFPKSEIKTLPIDFVANVFVANTEVLAKSIYVFNLKFGSSSSIGAIEITAPPGYAIQEASYIGGPDRFQPSSFAVTDSKMRLSFIEPVSIPPGTVLAIEIGGITNPSSTGTFAFEVATFDSAGSIVDAGSSSITISEPTIMNNSLGTEHIQDGAITTTKIAGGSINLDKLAVDVFFFFDNRISPLQEQINNFRAEFDALIQSEVSARMTSDNDEILVRASEDADIRDEIEELRQQIEELEAEIDDLRNNP